MNVVNKQLQLREILLKFRQHKGEMRKIGIDFNWGGKRKAYRERKGTESNNTMAVSKCHHETHAYSNIYI